MGQLGFETLLRLRPEDLKAEEKDDVYEQLCELQDSPEDLDKDSLLSLFAIAKEIMLYKGQQVESLLGDLEVLTSAQGGIEDKEELVRVTRQAEQLVEELQQKEKELLNEKQQVEKLLQDVGDLQKEKNDLRREIILIQNEVQSNALQTSLDDEPHENVAVLKDHIQSKNKHILQLLSDIEVFEKENSMLNVKLNAARREISDATTLQTKLSGENISLREANYQLTEKLTNLEEHNAGLASQISELVAEKHKKDARLDQLIDDLEERILKWQEVFIHKDNEVAELKARLAELAQNPESKPSSQFATNYSILAKTIEQQEEMIENLRSQLKEASQDLSKSSAEMIDYKKKVEKESKGEGSESLEFLHEELEKAKAQIVFLQEKANDAEQDAQFRAEEMTELIIQLREYEDGVYGLAEARKEIKELKKDIAIRDKQILNLVQQLNELHIKESGEDPIATSKKFNELAGGDDVYSDLDLKSQLAQIQQTAINLSVQNFDLRAKVLKLTEELNGFKSDVRHDENSPLEKKDANNDDLYGTATGETGEESDSKEDLENRLKLVIEENEALRRGMHEIMESIKNHDGLTKVNIESEILERLLEMLDSRHISGWYHPAMRLQAALNKLQGHNDALRQELRESRFRESFFQAELQEAFLKIGEQEEKLKSSKFAVDLGATELKPPVPAPRQKSFVVDSPMQPLLPDQTSSLTPTPKTDDSPVNNRVDSKTETSIKSPSADQAGEMTPVPEKRSRPSTSKSSKRLKSSSRHTSLRTSSPGSSSCSSPQKVESSSPLRENSASDSLLATQVRAMSSCGVQASCEFVSASTQTDFEINNLVKTPKPTLSRQASVASEGAKKDNGIQPRLETSSAVGVSPCTQDQAPTDAKQMEEFDALLQRKCEELRTEFSNIKANTEHALTEMYSTKDALFTEIRSSMTRISEEVDKMKKQPRQVQISTNDLGMKAYQAQEAKLANYGLKLDELKKCLYSKETLISAMEGRIRDLQERLDASTIAIGDASDKNVAVFQETIKNLQSILNQKEELISRYQELIKENGEEYNKLREQYRQLEASSSSNRVAVADTQAVGVLMEKWLTRVHHLEEDLRIMTSQLADASAALEQAKSEADHWKQEALSAQEKLNNAPERELALKSREIDELRNQLKDVKTHSEAESRFRAHQEISKLKRKEEHFKTKEKEYESEITRLKHQLSTRSFKGSTKTVKREMLLADRIKELEEEIDLMKQRERNHLQVRRDKCADEVAKWEERKKLQTSNERLKADVKEKSTQIELLEGQVTRLKQIVSRMERERVTLQRRLKVSEGLVARKVLDLKDFDDSRLTESRLGVSPSSITPASRSHTESPCSDVESSKVISKRDMIKAITTLKKVIVRLRAEKENFVHKDYVEQLRKELRKMEENYMDAIERSLSLEEQLRDKLCRQTFVVGSRGDDGNNVYLREQLVQKCELLGKVKILLQRAMVREKQLIQQVNILEKLVPPEKRSLLRQQSDVSSEPS